MHVKSKLGGMDEESSWEDSSEMKERSNGVKISPVSLPIIIFNLFLPLICFLFISIYGDKTPFFDFIISSLIMFVIYPVIMIRFFSQMEGVWSRVKGTVLIERNQGKVIGLVSFFLCMIIIPMWSLAPQLQKLKPIEDNLEK